MGMFSEANAGANAKKLEEILIHAAGIGGEVKEFAKEHLFEWYLYECGDAYDSTLPDKEIVDEYKD